MRPNCVTRPWRRRLPGAGSRSGASAAFLLSCSRHCTATIAGAFWLACLPALALLLVLASPAWAGPRPRRPLERSPLNDTPAAASSRGQSPPGNRKTRPESARAAAATIIASGAIRGRNHAQPVEIEAADLRGLDRRRDW